MTIFPSVLWPYLFYTFILLISKFTIYECSSSASSRLLTTFSTIRPTSASLDSDNVESYRNLLATHDRALDELTTDVSFGLKKSGRASGYVVSYRSDTPFSTGAGSGSGDSDGDSGLSSRGSRSSTLSDGSSATTVARESPSGSTILDSGIIGGRVTKRGAKKSPRESGKADSSASYVYRRSTRASTRALEMPFSELKDKLGEAVSVGCALGLD